jgi:hypothetical protein
MIDFFIEQLQKIQKSEKSFIIVRTCVGCVMPKSSKLIGTGVYKLNTLGVSKEEPYYDYQIDEDFMTDFINQNKSQLIDYKLLEADKKEDTAEDKNPVKDSSIRGYSKVIDEKVSN